MQSLLLGATATLTTLALVLDSREAPALAAALRPLLAAVIGLAATLTIGGLIGARTARADAWSDRFVLGYLAVSLWIMLIGFLGLLGAATAALPLGFAFLAMLPGRRPFSSVSEFSIPRELPSLLVVVTASIAFLWALSASFLPPAEMDALVYHLWLPDQYLIQGTILPANLSPYGHFPHLYELGLAPLLILDRTGTAANLFGALSFAALAHQCALLADGRAGELDERRRAAGRLWIAAAVLTSPILVNLVAFTKNDLFACAVAIAASRALLEGRMGMAGWLTGAAFAVKATTAFLLGPLALVLFIESRPRLLPVARFLAAATTLPALWMARSFLLSGELFPRALLSGQAPYSQFPHALPNLPHGLAGPVNDLHHLLSSFFQTFINGTDGPIGPFLLVLCLLAALEAGRDNRPALLATITGFLGVGLWSLLGNHQARYLLPLVVFGASVGAASLPFRPRWLRFSAVALVVVSGYSAVMLVDREVGFLRVHSGAVPLASYMTRALDSYRVQVAGDRLLPSEAYVLAVGEAALFHLHRKSRYSTFWEPELALAMAEECGDSETLRQRLRERGFTHVLYNPVILEQLYATRRKSRPSSPAGRILLEGMLSRSERLVYDVESRAGIYRL